MKVVITMSARLDVDEIVRHIATESVERALGLADELMDRCLELGDFPKAYPLVPRYEGQGVRRRAHGNYLIFYRIQAKQVEVLRVVHGARDYERFLFPSD
jgi:toxin ParE1/3/4